ncbi:MAG TPA: MFS transporter, partial [Streptomyces sp.]|nr:MFS transporter [Streptomyces sp.]
MREGSASGPVSTGSSPPHQTMALAAMLFAVSMTFIDQTIVAIAAPSIVDELDLSSSGMQWVVNAYLLALAAFFALGGRLADIVGHRRMMVIGTLIFVVSSVLCGCVPDDGFALG